MDDSEQAKGWTVEVDPEKCTMCEGCAKHCPTRALTLDRGEEALSLLFDASLCHGCSGGDSCQDICPEDAIVLARGAGGDGPQVLIASPLVECEGCHETFAAAQKLERLATAGRVHHELVRNLCPMCRREQLVVRFIEQERMPGAKAEYRSTIKILREAGKLREDT